MLLVEHKKAILLMVLAVAAIIAAISLADHRLEQPDRGSDAAVVPAKVPAFPGAEGGGMYATGGRGGEVYEVTTLSDSGPGSLRDAVSRGNRTVVFRVSGTIELKSPLYIRGNNLTIAGQTAPGDGITVAGYDTNIDADNVIIRYMRFRLGDISKREADAFGGRFHRNIIIDHCSTSWSVDEVLSLYAVSDVTVQWSILGESLTMSAHAKGAHGYGGIWGGRNATFHHNLIVHNSSRNPRFAGESPQPDNTIDFRNNVIYNWGFKASYGGENARVNVVNNYFKWGPDTKERAKRYLIDPAGPGGEWYVFGNYVDGFPDVTADNWKGVYGADQVTVKRTEPIPFANEVTMQTPQEAYEAVLNQAGATVPRRDAVDARLVADVLNRTGRQINSQVEVGGFRRGEASAAAPLDSDHDGMPDYWEKQRGLNPNNPEDRNRIGKDGYTELEMYLNWLADAGDTANPQVTLMSPAANQVFAERADISIAADVKPADGAKVRKVEFYRNDQKLGEVAEAPYRFNWSNVPEGTHYLSAFAVDDRGMVGQSAVVPVHVNSPSALTEWKSADIGRPGIEGHASSGDGKMILKSAGKIGGTSDAFRFVYQELAGDFDITARVEAVTAVANEVGAGVMIRGGLAPDSAAAVMRISYVKLGTGGAFAVRHADGASMQTSDSEDGAFPYWVRLSRRGDTITGYMSKDGVEWKIYGSAELKLGDTVYAGLAADAAKLDNRIDNYLTAQFTDVSVVRAQ